MIVFWRIYYQLLWFFEGLWGITLWALHVGWVSHNLYVERKLKCLFCPKFRRLKYYGVWVDKCGECGCFLRMKARLSGGTFDLGKWDF
jgi:hypothetical protein